MGAFKCSFPWLLYWPLSPLSLNCLCIGCCACCCWYPYTYVCLCDSPSCSDESAVFRTTPLCSWMLCAYIFHKFVGVIGLYETYFWSWSEWGGYFIIRCGELRSNILYKIFRRLINELCILQPKKYHWVKGIYSREFSQYNFIVAYVWGSNSHFKRMRSLAKLVKEATHCVEVSTDVLCDYLKRVCVPELLNTQTLLRVDNNHTWKLGDTGTDSMPAILRNQLPPRGCSLKIKDIVRQLKWLAVSLEWVFRSHLKFVLCPHHGRTVPFSYPGYLNFPEVIKKVSFNIKVGQTWLLRVVMEVTGRHCASSSTEYTTPPIREWNSHEILC